MGFEICILADMMLNVRNMINTMCILEHRNVSLSSILSYGDEMLEVVV